MLFHSNCHRVASALFVILPWLVDANYAVISPYRIVIDGGSTGSRLHIFEFVAGSNTLNHTRTSTSTNTPKTDKSALASSASPPVDCIRRGSSRANVPLSAFARENSDALNNISSSTTTITPLSPKHVAQHLLPLFDYAATIIPPAHHATTKVTYQGTAGMRLLSQKDQEEVYDALYEGLVESSTFLFTSMERQDIETLSGELEGYYGAIAANYLTGMIDTQLYTTDVTEMGEQKSQHHQYQPRYDGPIGALDMGGSSTQIVFSTKRQKEGETLCSAVEKENGKDDTTATRTCHHNTNSSRLDRDDFFSTSYLSYGVDQFRERLWSAWVNDRKQDEEHYVVSGKSVIIDNPCTFKGYKIEWEGYTLIGTGNSKECVQQVKRLIPHHQDVHDRGHYTEKEQQTRVVGGIQHPPLQGKFFAMSLYFFTLDSLRELSHPSKDAHTALNLSWPNPSIEELHNALDGLCSREWEGDLEDIQHDAHAYTRAEVLPHRCLESTYMVTLLQDGFGFRPESRDITFTFLVDGDEVEWSLGMAISIFAEEENAATEYTAMVERVKKEEVAVTTPSLPVESNMTCEDDCFTLQTTATTPPITTAKEATTAMITQS